MAWRLQVAAVAMTAGLAGFAVLLGSGAHPVTHHANLNLTVLFIGCVVAVAVGVVMFRQAARTSSRSVSKLHQLAEFQATGNELFARCMGCTDATLAPVRTDADTWTAEVGAWMSTNLPQFLTVWRTPPMSTVPRFPGLEPATMILANTLHDLVQQTGSILLRLSEPTS